MAKKQPILIHNYPGRATQFRAFMHKLFNLWDGIWLSSNGIELRFGDFNARDRLLPGQVTRYIRDRPLPGQVTWYIRDRETTGTDCWAGIKAYELSDNLTEVQFFDGYNVNIPWMSTPPIGEPFVEFANFIVNEITQQQPDRRRQEMEGGFFMAVKHLDYKGTPSQFLRDLKKEVNKHNAGEFIDQIAIEAENIQYPEDVQIYKLIFTEHDIVQHPAILELEPIGNNTGVKFHSTYTRALRFWDRLIHELTGVPLDPHNYETALKTTTIQETDSTIEVIEVELPECGKIPIPLNYQGWDLRDHPEKQIVLAGYYARLTQKQTASYMSTTVGNVKKHKKEMGIKDWRIPPSSPK